MHRMQRSTALTSLRAHHVDLSCGVLLPGSLCEHDPVRVGHELRHVPPATGACIAIAMLLAVPGGRFGGGGWFGGETEALSVPGVRSAHRPVRPTVTSRLRRRW